MSVGAQPLLVEVISDPYEHHYPGDAPGSVRTALVQDVMVTCDSVFPRYSRLRVDGMPGYKLGLYRFDLFGLLTVFRDELRVVKFPRLEPAE